MFISSIVYYLVIKKAQLEKIESKLYMVFNFSIPGFAFLFFNLLNRYQILIEPKILFLIFLSSLFLSYIGSVISYIAINQAPNAGYSLVIQKSNAVYTSIAAIFIFVSELKAEKYLAILIIILSTAIISITKKRKISIKNYSWVILSFISFFCFGTLRLTNKLFVSYGIPATVMLFWTMLFVTLISLVDLFFSRKKIKTKLSTNKVLILVGLGVSVTFFYYFLQISEISAPNLGYVGAINTASNAFYTVLVALIFKDQFLWKKFLAVLGVSLGVIFLIF